MWTRAYDSRDRSGRGLVGRLERVGAGEPPPSAALTLGAPMLTSLLVHLQCGRPEQEHISSFQRIQGGDLTRGDKIIQASAGAAHSLLLTEDGKVFAVGTAEKGVLGNGRTGEHIAGSRVLFQTESEPLLVKGAIQGKKIVQITSGQQHNVALDSEGYCYAWGFGGEFFVSVLQSVNQF